MAEDIKTTLYALLGKKKLGCPTYDCKEERRGKITRFKCELRVPNMNYVGLGCSTNKKNAMSNAARDFGMFMIREHLCVASELPNLLEDDIEMNAPPDANLWGGPQPSLFDVKEPFTLVDSANPYGNVNAPRMAMHRTKTEHDEYIEQKAAEVAQSEAVDMGSQIHGGWSMENCKRD
jgi:ATP-dependent RNA helicase A